MLHYEGILIGLLSFVIIGVFHPLVIKTEYYWGKGSWWLYLLFGIVFAVASLFISDMFWSVLLGVLAFSCFWTIKETFEQEGRVKKGWFPANPRRKGLVTVRQETSADYDSIRRINERAFGRLDEGFLIEKLRRNSLFNPALSLVAEKNNIVVGHILFFPLDIIDPSGNKYRSLGLAPMSVFPEFQSAGIGSGLVRKGLQAAKQQSYDSVVVLGHPDYYPRFGFQKASLYGIKSPYDDCPDEAFMILELKEGALSGISGKVCYTKEFDIFN